MHKIKTKSPGKGISSKGGKGKGGSKGDMPSSKGKGKGDMPSSKGKGKGDMPSSKGMGKGDMMSSKGKGDDMPSSKGKGKGNSKGKGEPSSKGKGKKDGDTEAPGKGSGTYPKCSCCFEDDCDSQKEQNLGLLIAYSQAKESIVKEKEPRVLVKEKDRLKVRALERARDLIKSHYVSDSSCVWIYKDTKGRLWPWSSWLALLPTT